MPDPLELDTRRRLVDLVRKYPGLHLRELARQADTSIALVEYHVPPLVEAGLVRVEPRGGVTCLFPQDRDISAADEDKVVALRAEKGLAIALWMLRHGEPCRHAELAAGVRLRKATLSFHLRKLQEAGVVHKRPDGRFELLEPEQLQELLSIFKPTRTLLDRFASLWGALYD